jgi:hypothetical protein
MHVRELKINDIRMHSGVWVKGSNPSSEAGIIPGYHGKTKECLHLIL